jgi:hypothetical protein
MDKVEQLYNLYLQNGIITSSTTLQMFREANADQQASLYEFGKKKNLFKSTDLPTFQSAWTAPKQEQQPQQEVLKKKEQSGTTASPSGVSSLASPSPMPQPEEKDYFTGAFGDVLRGLDNIVPLGIGDFVDDIARSAAAGYNQGQIAEQAGTLALGGSKATPEEIQKFIDANKNAQQLGQSKEAQDFSKIYNEEGGGFWGVVKGLAFNPSYIPEIMTSSLVSLATNSDALMAGASAVGTGATYGGTTGAAAGGVGAIPGAVAGAAAAIPYAFGLATGVVEAGSYFAEGLEQQLQGKEMTKENVKAILENPEKLQELRNGAVARGIAIGAADALTGKLASKVGANILSKSAAKSATGAATKAATTGAVAAGSVIEAAGGSAGEAAARAITGQDMDTAEIMLEGIAELPGGVRSTIQAKLAKPEYKVNGEKVSAEEVDNLIETMTPAQLQKTKIDIKNDYEGRAFKIQDKIVTDVIKNEVKQANPDLNNASVKAITELEKELRTLENNKTQVGKDKVADIKSKIKDIQENQLPEEVEVINVPGPERRTEVLHNEETLAEALRNIDDQQAESFGFVDENGDTIDLRDNEDRIAQEYFDSIGAQNNSNPLTQSQMSAKTIVDKLFGEDSMNVTDASWANDLNDDSEYELNFKSKIQIPFFLRDNALENNDGTYTVKAKGSDIKSQFKNDIEFSYDDNKSYTFDFPSMEAVPDQYRDQVQEIDARTEKTPRRFLGIPIGFKNEEVRGKIFRVNINGADAKKLKLQPQRAANVKDVAKNVAKSMASLFPDMPIMTFNNADEMRAHAAENFNEDIADTIIGDEGGMIINDASGKPMAILINDENADVTTLPHEAWHAILLKAFGENAALFEEFKNGIEKALRANGMMEIVNELDAFANTDEYINSNMQAEEWLVQLGGLLTASGITQDNVTPQSKKLLTQIKEVFNSIAVKITGKPIFLEDATPDDVLEFMVAISDRMARGMDITEFFRENQPTAGVNTAGVSSRTQRLSPKQKLIEQAQSKTNYFLPNMMGGVNVLTPENYAAMLQEFIDTGAIENVDRYSTRELTESQFPLEESNGVNPMSLRDADAAKFELEGVKESMAKAPAKAKKQVAGENAKITEEKINDDNLTNLNFREFNVRFQISNKKKEEFKKMLEKKRPELKEQGLIDSVIQDVEKFGEENSQNKQGNPKLEKLAMHWIYNANVILPEDGYKIVDAEKVATKNKVDPFAYNSPEELMEAFAGTVKAKPIDPDTVPSFTNRTEIPGTDIVMYDVADTKEGQADVRKAIDTNWGEDANPWCLAARINGSLDDAWTYWKDRYNAIDKKIAFKNGKLLCFRASSKLGSNTWWNRMDKPSEGIPATENIGDNRKQEIIYDDNGEAVSKGNITRKTKLSFEEWDSEGKPIREERYNKDGKLDGMLKKWWDNGILRFEANYKDGKVDGIERVFATNGVLIQETYLKDDLRDGIEKRWTAKGILIYEDSYKNNKLNGISKSYREDDGSLLYEEDYKDGKRNGVSKTYYDNGSLLQEITFKDGKKNGVSKEYYDNGELEREKEYKNDVLDGDFKFYIKGKLAIEKEFKNGFEVFSRSFDDNGEIINEFGKSSKVKFQRPSGAALLEVQKIGQRYNINEKGFMPKEANQFALAKELARFGLGAKRSRVTPEGYGGSLYMTDAAGKFYNPMKVRKQRISLSGGRLNPNVNTIEGYDRMMDQVQTIIDKSERRGVAKDKIMQNVMEYVTKSKVYERANDSQREQLVRNIETEFGKKQKSAPSVGKILGTIKDITKITLPEKELLKQHFRDLAKGARDAKRAFMQASDDLSLAVSELAKSGKISPKQLSNVIRKFSKVNMLNEDSINGFVDYMTKVFEDADYAEKIAGIRVKVTKARGNLKSKIGVADAIANPMRKLLSVNPTLIPDDVFDKYLNIVNMFSANQAVLPLKDISEISQDINDIFQSLDEQLSKSEELAIRFDDFADKVVDDKNGKIQYADTVNKMEKDGIVTAEEAELMKKYKSVIFPTEKKEGKTAAEIQAENNALIKAITDAKINLDSLALKDERELADNIRRLLKPELLKQLTTAQLTNLIKLIDNINNGFMPHYGMLAFERLNAIKNATPVGEATLAAKPLPVTQVYNNLKSKFTKKGGVLEMARAGGFFFIDQVFSNFKTKPIFNALFDKISESQSVFTSELGQVNKKLDAAKDAVTKSFAYNANKTLESSFKMMAYMIQLEYESNPGNKQVNPASVYIKETIKAIKRGKTKYGDKEIKMLERILDENGNVDKDALYNSFNKAEKNAIKTIREINDGLTEKAVYTAAVIRGQRIDALNNYVHLPVMSEYNPDESAVATQVANDYNNNLNPSTKGKNLIERTTGAKPINFDVFASAQRGAKFTLLDYHMTTPIRTARKTLNEVENRYGDEFTKQQREIFNAIRDGFEEVVSDVLTNNFVATSTADEIVNFISKQGYRVVLASSFRFAAELLSNIGFVTVAGRKAFAEGLKYFSILSSPDAVNIMDNVRSKQTTRLYHGDTLSGRFIDRSVLSQTSGVKSATSKGVIANKANQIYNMSLKKYKNGVELIADTLISTPDRVIMRPVWFGQFATEFKKQSGKDVDFKKIADNNEYYMRENKDAIEAAKLRADEMSVLAGATDNPFMGMVKGSTKPNQSMLLRAFNNFNTYMTRFAMYEYTTARQGVYAAMGNGSISRKEGIALLAAVTARMTVYTLLTNMFAGGLAGLLGDEEEEDEKTLMQKLGQSFASTSTSLLLGRNFGNATKMLVNYGVEEVNDEFLDFLRNGDYDPYKDAISFSAIPKEKKAGETNIADFIGNMSGSFSPAMKTSNLIIKKAFAKEKKEPEAIKRSEEENTIRIPLEVLGNLGMVPLYKDVRREVMNELYKDLRNADKKAEDKKQAEKEMLHGYDNREDMKRYDPDLYDEVFGKDSPAYDAQQAKKKLKHEADSIERRLKDEFYDYVPKKKGGFGTERFGKSKSKRGGFGSERFGQ